MALPVQTPEQRAEALRKAKEARAAQSAIRAHLKNGTLTLSDVLEDNTGPAGSMKVSSVLGSLPGMGKARTAALLERHGIAATKRVKGLGLRQRAALEREFAPAT